jgi:hypothetical protein
VSGHRRRAGRHARPGSRLRHLIVPLILVVLATVAGIGWAVALTSNRDSATSAAAVTARPADATAAPTTITPTTMATPPPHSTRATLTSALTSTTMSPSTTQSRRASLLQQTMLRPNGVAAQMDVDMGGAGGGNCASDYAPYQVQKPTIGIGAGDDPSVTEAWIGTPVRICLLRFTVGTPVQVTIRSPTGQVERLTAPAPPCAGVDCTTQTAWGPLPGDRLGAYDVTATQENVSAKAKIVVEPTGEPSLMIIGSTSDEETRVTVEPGTTVGIAVAGFAPRRSVGLLFYYTPSFNSYPKGLQFRASTTVMIDTTGGAVFWLRTSRADPLGCYLVNTWPPLRAGITDPGFLWASQSSWHQFCLQH